MKKLNNKGMTIVELLVSFILLVIIMSSLYNTVSVYRIKQNVESYKGKIVSYKNLLTKEIQDDIIKKGLVHAEIVDNELENKNEFHSSASGVAPDGTEKRFDTDITVKLLFKDGTKKVINVIAKHAIDFGICSNSTDSACDHDHDDIYSIGYGTSITSDDYTIYTLPDLGYGYNGNGKCGTLKSCSSVGHKIYDFSINTVDISIKDNIFTFYVGFYHPNFETRYGINIVSPIKII